MNQILSKAISDVSALSEADQNEIALEMIDLAARKRIEARLALSEEMGDYMPSAQFFKELKARYAR